MRKSIKDKSRPMIDRLLPIPENSGFKMEGYFVWCGSMIRVGDQYHLFASRWPEGTGSDPNHYIKIFDGYKDYSEIVSATADKSTGPFDNFRGSFWPDAAETTGTGKAVMVPGL